MDIFVINSSHDIDSNLLLEFQKKEISNTKVLQTHCLSYLMVDRILKEVYKISEREIEFIDKKPFLMNRQKYFSISHSNEYIVLGFSDYNCGIDIELIKPRDFVSITKRMKFECKTLDEFYAEWTKYEAEYKLGKIPKSQETFQYQDYFITSVSENADENFQIFIQTPKDFSNSSN